jgi:hypothetical protein
MAMRTAVGQIFAAALVSIGLTVASAAQAITFDLTSDHCSPAGCGTPPFGTVDVTQVGVNASIVVTLAAGFQYAQVSAADFQIFKFNGVGVVLGDIIVGAHVPALAAATGAFNGDGTGDFDFGINCPSCGNGPTGFGGAIAFIVSNATITDLTQPNALGNIFVADVLSPNGNIGPVDVSVIPNQTPEPASLALLGLGLAGLVWSRRKK